ncbi:hypothetical protein IKG07_02855 [Candidatus Saccharibacteria bacterium]|nr:hypothetical protein [Candidatus Saccharibacteria bacterium]
MLKVVRNLICCVCLLFVLSILVFSGSSANADTVDYIVNVAPSLNITLSTDNVVLDLNPNTKTSDSKDLNIKVSTNNMTGYQLTMSSTGNATDLVRDNTVDGKNATIPTLSAEAGSTAASLTDNTWGYKKDSGNFIPYVSGVKLLENNVATNEDETTLSFASKIDWNQSAGSYALSLVFTGMVNPLCDTTISGVMQTFNPCPDMAIGTSGTLTDTRDGKTYTAAKLADGQIWMTSNLNLAGGTKLYSETSNVPAGYPESAGVGYYTLPASSATGFSDSTVAYVYNTGNETTNQADCNTSPGCNSYYSWLAATAGGKDASGTAVTGNGEDAPYSICPKGWRLPKSGNSSDTSATSTTGYKKGDFYKLATAYGVNLESQNSVSSANFYNNAGPGTLPNFLLAGYYSSNRLYSGGTGGFYWSSSSYSSGSAYYFNFGSSRVNSANGNSRYFGSSVRCVFAGV